MEILIIDIFKNVAEAQFTYLGVHKVILHVATRNFIIAEFKYCSMP